MPLFRMLARHVTTCPGASAWPLEPLEARMVKANKVGGRWVCRNLKSKQEGLLSALNTPLTVDFLLQHT